MGLLLAVVSLLLPRRDWKLIGMAWAVNLLVVVPPFIPSLWV
jgi:hypothetical protein